MVARVRESVSRSVSQSVKSVTQSDSALDTPRPAATSLQGTEGVTLDKCTFERLDGNGVMVSGYNRNTTITNSDFAYIGGNAVAAWGYTNETDTDPGRPGVAIENAPAAGVDGTDGEHPRYTTVVNCTAREVGPCLRSR